MPLPPLGEGAGREAVLGAWEILAQANREGSVSRVEGWESSEVRRRGDAGWRWQAGESEYLYRRTDLVSLRGDRFRSQRGAVNRFRKRVPLRVRPFEEKDLVPCLQLYTLWGIRLQQAHPESYPRALVRDGLFFHRRLMMDREKLGLTGRVLEGEGRVLGYTFGAPLSRRLFCVLLETADRSVPGAAQTLFQEFCRELEGYSLINAMGDAGIEGLRRAKRAYRPVGFVSTQILVELKGFGASPGSLRSPGCSVGHPLRGGRDAPPERRLD